jgi:hypothetical protein
MDRPKRTEEGGGGGGVLVNVSLNAEKYHALTGITVTVGAQKEEESNNGFITKGFICEANADSSCICI